MSFVSVQAKLYKHNRDNKCICNTYEPIRKDYTNFAGTSVRPLTKGQWDKGMALSHKYRKMREW